MKFNALTSKAVWGAITWAIGFLLQPGVLSALPEKVSAFIQALGVILGVYGIRVGVAKASQGIAQSPWFIGAFALLLAGTATLPSPFPLTLAPNENYGMAGDSLKYVVSWKQPADSATLGKADSTFYRFVSSKGVTFFGSTGLTTPATPLRRTLTGLADSLKLAKPAVGDSVTFQITNFQQCRKGDCSIPGSAAWKYRRSYAPPPASPNIQITEF